MSNDYDVKSCSALEKPYYRPIEAALRWCNLIEHEALILTKTGSDLFPPIGEFPQWPCLRLNAEKIFDAIQNNELPHGRDGRTVVEGDHVAPHRVTIRHNDLKIWMATYSPNAKPKFLFDEIERTTHTAINKEAFIALQVDRDALKARIDKAEVWAKEAQIKIKEISAENKSLQLKVGSDERPLSARTENNYLRLIMKLANGIKGFNPQKPYEAAQLIIDETETDISKQTIADYISKAYELESQNRD